jgi:hypothetical protein
MIHAYGVWLEGRSKPVRWLVTWGEASLLFFLVNLAFTDSLTRCALHAIIAGAAWTTAMAAIFDVLVPILRRRHT